MNPATSTNLPPALHPPDLMHELDAGLALAGSSTGTTFIALPAPVIPGAAIVDQMTATTREHSLVAWASADLALVGVDVAVELRGRGQGRWAEVIAGAHAFATNTADVDDEPRDTMPAVDADAPLREQALRAVLGGKTIAVESLGFARPRFIGGAAFAPGAAEKAPWIGFGDAWFVLPRWTYVSDGDRALLVLAVDARAAADAGRWREELARFRAAFIAGPTATTGQPPLVEITPAPAETWRTQVTDITDAIARGECSKIVAARTCSVQLGGSVRLGGVLAALDERHADTMRVLVKPPGAGALVAAAPERLVRRDGDLVECDALAGSISPNGDPDAAEATLRASAKDQNEHQLVVDAIRAALADTGEVSAPATPNVKRLRHIIHLHTPFRTVLRSPRHVLELAARLHPTPAVGGTPALFAREWIATHEPVARGWYSSPVGWFDLDGNGELAVALRMGVISNNKAHLWAGGGIVAGSDPDKELAETEMKLRAVLNALGAQS